MQTNTQKDLAIIKAKELSLVEENSLTGAQLKHLLKKTPKQYVKSRPAKGGGQWEYVTGGYVKKVLNLMFGWDWDFEIVDETIHMEAKQVIVKGRLTVRSGGRALIKMQYGRQDIKVRKADGQPLDLGNDMKGAATDCLKKCASEFGIAADIYNKEDFREVNVAIDDNEQMHTELKLLFELKKDMLQGEDVRHIERILQDKEVSSYSKILNTLKDL